MSGRRTALIVATDEYDHPGLRRLVGPTADAVALGDVLSDPQIGGFAVRVVHNQPAHVIQGHIDDVFSESRLDDVLLLHFSCHGLKSESGELFLAARNTSPNRLGSTAVSADFVQRCMRTSRSRSIVLLLDCCYGGAFGQGVRVRAAGDVNVLDSFPTGNLGSGRGRAVITASSAMEYAFEGNELADHQSRRPSIFTAALVEGLSTGDADRDEDGWISLNELYDYVFGRVRERTPHQTPTRNFEMQGELFVARSRRRRIRPLPVPPELEAARTDSNMFTRIGAVHELRTRLVGENVPMAAGAFAALAETVGTDIRYVADVAEAALREAVIRPADTDVHFGAVPQGRPAPHRGVRLLGPPVARTVTPRASDHWIQVAQTDGGFVISIDTTEVGTRHGHVTLNGPTGEAVVAVHVDVIAPTPIPAPMPAAPAPQWSPPPISTPLPDRVPAGRFDNDPLVRFIRRTRSPERIRLRRSTTVIIVVVVAAVISVIAYGIALTSDVVAW
jgi:hypothetical protein